MNSVDIRRELEYISTSTDKHSFIESIVHLDRQVLRPCFESQSRHYKAIIRFLREPILTISPYEIAELFSMSEVSPKRAISIRLL